MTLTEPLTVVDAPEESDDVRFALAKFVAFCQRIWRDEPTLLAEIASWLFVAPWSVALLLYRTGPFPVSIAEQFERGPYFTMAILGIALAVVQLVAMVSLRETPRALCSFCTACWLGGLGLSLLMADYRIGAGLGYFSLGLLALIPCLKVWRGRRI